MHFATGPYIATKSLSLEAISYSFIQKLVIFETPTKLG